MRVFLQAAPFGDVLHSIPVVPAIQSSAPTDPVPAPDGSSGHRREATHGSGRIAPVQRPDGLHAVIHCKRCGRELGAHERKCPGCGASRVGYVPAALLLAVMILLLELVVVVAR